MHLQMATAAERHEIILRGSASVCKRKNVVYFLGSFIDAVFEALFTQRILFYFPVPDAFPRSAVGILIIGALVLVVELLRLCFVLRAILFTRCGEAWATRVSAWSFRLSGHCRILLSGKAKVTGDFSSMTFCILLC
jgi:hypothetical protein